MIGSAGEQMQECGMRLHEEGEFCKLRLSSVAKYCCAHGNGSLIS